MIRWDVRDELGIHAGDHLSLFKLGVVGEPQEGSRSGGYFLEQGTSVHYKPVSLM